MVVIAEAANGKQAVRQFMKRRPDLLLLDLRMPDDDGVETIWAIRQKAHEAKIVIISTYGREEDIYRALKAGARAYLLKDSPRLQLLETIRGVYGGKISIPSEIGVKLATRLAAPSLARREIAVLRLMVSGKSNKEIAMILGITTGTVKVHAGHIFAKLGANGRADAIRLALERGVVHLKNLHSD